MAGRLLTLGCTASLLAIVSSGCLEESSDETSSSASATETASTAPDPEPCTKLKAAGLEVLRQGLRRTQRDVIKIEAGTTVALPEKLSWPLGDKGRMWVAAVRITDGKRQEVDLFALGDPQANGGLVLGIGDSLNWFTYGDAVMPGSPAGDYLDEVEQSDEADAARRCLKGEPTG